MLCRVWACHQHSIVQESLTALSPAAWSSHPLGLGDSLKVTFAEKGRAAQPEHHSPDVVLSPWGSRVLAWPTASSPQVPPLVMEPCLSLGSGQASCPPPIHGGKQEPFPGHSTHAADTLHPFHAWQDTEPARNRGGCPSAGRTGVGRLASPVARKSPSVSSRHTCCEIMWLPCFPRQWGFAGETCGSRAGQP